MAGMKAQVAYTVPVEVVVDFESGTVERVVVIDEAIALDWETGVRTLTWLEGVGPRRAQRARRIAERAEWPAWEHGW